MPNNSVNLNGHQADQILRALLSQHDGDDRDGTLAAVLRGLFNGTLSADEALTDIARRIEAGP